MLAGKVAAEHDCLDAIRDATELYEHYYEKQLKSLAAGETWIISAGIMAFVHVLRLDTLNDLICETEQHDVDVRSIPFSKTKSHDNINDFIIEIKVMLVV